MKAMLAVLLLLALASCANGDRTKDADRQPVFYGGVSGSAGGR